MFGDSEGYDQSVSIYSPEGRIYQVEYARASSMRGSPAVAIETKDGFLIVAMKGGRNRLRRSELLDKIYPISKNIAMVTSGLISDARVIIDYAREVATWYRVSMDTEPEISHILPELKELLWIYTEYGGVRPFGVSSIVVGREKGRIRAYSLDVSGVSIEKKACAVGNRYTEIEERLEDVFKEGMSWKKAQETVLSVLKDIFGDLKDFEIDICRVSMDGVGEIEHL